MAIPAGYRPQLDALRTLAAAMVAIHHWEDFEIAGRAPQFGFLGVSMFFVLSGYLITGILLDIDDRRRKLANPIGMIQPIVAFYVRRFLRLFPAYYFLLFFTWIAGIITWDDGLAWYLAYATNIRVLINDWDTPVAHLWTLAVEEQFYLLAPWVVLGLGRRRLVVVMAATAVIGLLFLPPADVVPPGAFAGLLVGCLLAVVADRRQVWADRLGRVWPAVFVCWIVVYALAVEPGDASRLGYAAFRLLAFVALAGLVWRAAVGVGGLAGRVLEWRPAVWLGKLSYGIYLWHTLAQDMTIYLGFDYDNQPLPLRLAVVTAVTLTVTLISWRIVEQPFLGLKDRFPYLPPAETVDAPGGRTYSSAP